MLSRPIILLSALLITACSSMQPSSNPLTVPEIVRMSSDSVPADEIIRRITKSGTSYHLSATQLADLRTQGVPDPVIDYMQQTYLDAVRADQRLRDEQMWFPCDGYRYYRPWGSPFWGW